MSPIATLRDAHHDAWSPAWAPRAIVAFVVATVVCVIGYVAAGVGAQIRWFETSQLLSLAAFAVGVRTSRPGFRRDWYLLLAAITIWVVGNIFGAAQLTGDGDLDEWQPSIIMSATAFALTIVAILRLARRDGFVRGASVALDSVIYVLGVALCWWIVIGRLLVFDVVRPAPGAVVAALIPLADGLLLAAVSALMSSRSSHALSSRALVAMCFLGCIGDLGFAYFALTPTPTFPPWVGALWMLQFAAAGVAALASGRASMRPETDVSVTSIYLALESLLAPVLVALWAGVRAEQAFRLRPATVLVIIVGTVVSAVLQSVRERGQVRRIMEQATEMERTARTDHLTSLPNRRAGDRILEGAITAARTKDGVTLAVAILDLDKFKLYNDTFGHQRGDALLREASAAWAEVMNGLGTLFRYGGEEFVAILPQTSLDEADAILAAMRAATPHGQSFSAGLAALEEGEHMAGLLHRADTALYRAKDAGRARTAVAPGRPSPRRPEPVLRASDADAPADLALTRRRLAGRA